MRDFGRIAVIGSISSYNTPPSEWPKVPILQPIFVAKQLKMEGFFFSRFWNRWFEGMAQLKQWTDEGKLKYHETITEGFENMPAVSSINDCIILVSNYPIISQALSGTLQGKFVGKAVVTP